MPNIPDGYIEPPMDEISRNIWLGGIESAHDLNSLQSHNIKYIVNCTPDIENKFLSEIKYFNIPINDNRICDVSLYEEMITIIIKSFKFIDEAIDNNIGVLIHCKRGHHRSANILLFYLVYKYNISYLYALYKINKIRHHALVRNTCINSWGMTLYKIIIIMRQEKIKFTC